MQRIAVLFIVIAATGLHGSPQNQNQNPCTFIAANESHQRLVLEERRVELEERKVYIAALEGSPITEDKARDISLMILKTLKDYPQGKKAKHADEDVKFLVETIAAINKRSPSN